MSRLNEDLRKTALVVALACSGLAGCMVTADTTYSTFHAGPGYRNEQIYENRVYGDTQQGVGAESCQEVRRSEVDPFGRASTVTETVCR